MATDLDDLAVCRLPPSDSDNFERWGKLVKTWATGDNKFQDNNDYSLPARGESVTTIGTMTKDDFQKMLDKAGVIMRIPDGVTRFKFVQDDDNTVIVRVPSKQMVENVEHKLHGGIDSDHPSIAYPFLPQFYKDTWNQQAQKALDENELLRMHAQRIGEYTINVCG
jgi:hypothetical protein